MATVVRLGCRARAFQANSWPAVSYRSYAASALKSKQNPSTSRAPSPSSPSRTLSTPVKTLTPSIPTTSVPDAQEKEPKVNPKATAALEEIEFELQQLEHLKRLPKILSETDVWGSELTSLDVEIPYDLRLMFRALRESPKFSRRKLSNLWYAISHNTSNWMKNAFSMFTIARVNAFPGIDTSKPSFGTWRRIGDVQSNSRHSLLAPLREIALETYCKVNSAVARQSEGMMKEFTSGAFQEKTLQQMRRRERGQYWSWNITSDVSESAMFPKDPKTPTPVTVVSVRASEVYLATEDPKYGNRLAIQALIKFDTTQKIDMMTMRGAPIKSELAKPRRVVQYLLLEKVGWYDTPWKIKDQMYKV